MKYLTILYRNDTELIIATFATDKESFLYLKDYPHIVNDHEFISFEVTSDLDYHKARMYDLKRIVDFANKK